MNLRYGRVPTVNTGGKRRDCLRDCRSWAFVSNPKMTLVESRVESAKRAQMGILKTITRPMPRFSYAKCTRTIAMTDRIGTRINSHQNDWTAIPMIEVTTAEGPNTATTLLRNPLSPRRNSPRLNRSGNPAVMAHTVAVTTGKVVQIPSFLPTVTATHVSTDTYTSGPTDGSSIAGLLNAVRTS